MKNRNVGIDLLRIIAMLMIVILHCFTAGGISDNAVMGTAAYNTSAIMIIINCAGVDIFAIISGYVAYYNEGKRTDFSKYIELWIQVVFYGVLINLIFGMANPDTRVLDNYIMVLFPVTAVTYWYFSAYTGLYVMKPLIDKGLKNSGERFLKCLTLVLFLVAFLSTFSNAFMINSGYTVLWLIILYVIGYSINKFDLMKKNNNITLILIIIISVGVMYGSVYMIPEKQLFIISLKPFTLSSYASPLVVLFSICMVILFSRIKMSPRIGKIVSLLSSTAFSIYIVNRHPMFWELIVKDAYIKYANSNALTILIKVFSFSVPFVIFVMVFDLFRIYLFKTCKINVLADKIEEFIRRILIKASSVF